MDKTVSSSSARRGRAQDPTSRLNRAHSRSRSRKRTALATGEAAIVQTPHGPVRHSKAWTGEEGGFVTTRKDDYGGVTVGHKYKDLKPAYTASSSDKGRNSRAKLHQIAFAKEGAEERRNPGAGKLGRAADKQVREGKASFEDMFGSQTSSHYLPARTGGAAAMRGEFASGKYSDTTKAIAADMSDSSDEESKALALHARKNRRNTASTSVTPHFVAGGALLGGMAGSYFDEQVSSAIGYESGMGKWAGGVAGAVAGYAVGGLVDYFRNPPSSKRKTR